MQLTDVAEVFRLDLLFRLVLACVLGGAIGLEREYNGKPAGFRTNLLICLGSALLTEMSVWMVGPGGENPSRISAQIVSGIGFLGAGTIIQARGSVTGLTTAATLWVVSAIGIAVGAGAYIEAVGTTLLVLLALLALGRFETQIIRRRSVERRLVLTLDAGGDLLERVRAEIRGSGLEVEELELTKQDGMLSVVVLTHGRPAEWIRLKNRLIGMDGIRSIGGL